MFNRTTALILLVALAAGLGLMAGKKFFDRDGGGIKGTAGIAPEDQTLPDLGTVFEPVRVRQMRRQHFQSRGHGGAGQCPNRSNGRQRQSAQQGTPFHYCSPICSDCAPL